MKKMKKLASLVLAMIMVLAMAMNVSAANGYTITINNDATGHVYEAYQVFAGDLSEDETTLSNVVWGSGVDGDGLLAALNEVEAFAECKSAADVAAVLDGAGNDSDLAKDFAAIVGDHLTTAAGDSGETSDPYVITVEKAGYYLIKDKNVTGHDSYTRYILKVVDNVEVEHKGTVPTVDKKIANGETEEAATFNIGDTIEYVLTGTLPENYADYTTYKYVFHDTLTDGLAYNNDAKVYVVNGEADPVEVTESFAITFENNKLTVSCNDLKDIKGVEIDADSEIVVEYTCTLDEDAVIGNDGNPNTVYLEFSNDPNYDGDGTTPPPTGETPEDTVVVFTFELDVTKVDGKDNKVTLEGAEFKLRNEAGKWVTVDEDGKVTGWENAEADGSTLTSDDNGFFNIIGLEDGTYYLKETKAPDGYNLLEKEITIVITSTYDENGVKTLTITVDTGDAKAGNVSTGIVSTVVENNAGTVLPSTGGMGTTLFYLIGGSLVVLAAVLLITRRRMNAE